MADPASSNGSSHVPHVARCQECVDLLVDYLEGELPEQGFLFGAPGLADFSLACFFRNAAFAGFTPDAERWPRSAGFVTRVLALEVFERLRPFEERMLRTRIPRQRAALAELGAPLAPESLGGASPRRGVLPV